MPVYEWKGIDGKGKNKKGIIDAESPRSAREKMKKKGIFLSTLNESKSRGTSESSKQKTPESSGLLSKQIDFKRYFQRVTQAEVAIITRLLANMFGANIPVVESLTAIIDQVENEEFKRILSQIREEVNEGAAMSDAMSKYPKLFPPIYTNMVRAGESSGSLEIVMDRLADYTENQMALISRIKGAMTYPVIMLLFAVIVMGILFTLVIPKITRIFQEAKITLPITTRMLIGISEIVASYWYLIILLFLLAFFLFRKWKATPSGRRRWDKWMLRAPILGELVRMIAVSRFSRTLSTMLSSGVPLLMAMGIVKNILNNVILVDVLEEARKNIREGESIAIPLRRSGEFPPIVTHMIAIGEKSGQLEEMLGHIAKNYDVQVDSKINALTSLLEPLMIVVMGIVVSFIVLSILLPILQLNQQLG